MELYECTGVAINTKEKHVYFTSLPKNIQKGLKLDHWIPYNLIAEELKKIKTSKKKCFLLIFIGMLSRSVYGNKKKKKNKKIGKLNKKLKNKQK